MSRFGSVTDDPPPTRTRRGGASPYREPDGPQRPPRPVAVEVAAALMVVSGIIATLTTVEAWLAMGARGEPATALVPVSLAIGVGTTLLGILVRTGRAWLVALNVVAVEGFLELTSGTVPGWLFGGIDVVVVLILLRERPWFSWRDAADEGDDEDDDRDEAHRGDRDRAGAR